MNQRTWIATIALAATLAGCGAKQADQDAASSNDASTTTGSGTSSTMPAVSKYDSGPRAGDAKANDDLAKRGETLFKDKGCSACHGFGQKLTGPDLAGVSMRRTQEWLENQILHPEVMTKEDPIARELMAKHALQMPNQKLTPEEAKAIIEYFKHTDHEAGEKD
jgi:mono/diheme cytochrome c family protein